MCSPLNPLTYSYACELLGFDVISDLAFGEKLGMIAKVRLLATTVILLECRHVKICRVQTWWKPVEKMAKSNALVPCRLLTT